METALLDAIVTDPVAPLAREGGVLGVVTGLEGSAYRPVGACIAFARDSARLGTISSGCVEESLAIEAESVARSGGVHRVRFGRGSPWIDIQLPCGAGLDVTLWSVEPGGPLVDSVRDLGERRAHALVLPEDGGGTARTAGLAPAGWSQDGFILPRIPPLRFKVFGAGVETVAFTAIARGAGYEVDVASPESWVRERLPDARPLSGVDGEASVAADPQTAVVLFFHDHAYEIPLLKEALAGEAFWIGAQGSKRARMARLEGLARAGVRVENDARLRSAIGAIASARDPQTLAVSVLADIVGAYKACWLDRYLKTRVAAVPA